MILDSQNLFSDAQNIAVTTNASNVIDQGPNTGLINMVGTPICVFARVMAAFAGGTSLQVSLISADDPGLSTNLATHFSSPVIPTASLAARALILANRVPPQKLRRYLGLAYAVVGTMTAGAITAGIVDDLNSVQLTSDFNKGFTV